VRPRILLRLSLDFLGVWLFEESRQLRTEFGEMVEQLRISKIVRSRNVRVPIDWRSRIGESARDEPTQNRRTQQLPGPQTRSDFDERLDVILPIFSSQPNAWAALGQMIIPINLAN